MHDLSNSWSSRSVGHLPALCWRCQAQQAVAAAPPEHQHSCPHAQPVGWEMLEHPHGEWSGVRNMDHKSQLLSPPPAQTHRSQAFPPRITARHLLSHHCLLTAPITTIWWAALILEARHSPGKQPRDGAGCLPCTVRSLLFESNKATVGNSFFKNKKKKTSESDRSIARNFGG